MSEFRRKLMMAYAANLGRGDIIYPGLIAAWSAKGKSNDDADRATLKDLTGNGHDITLNGFAFLEMSGYGGYTTKLDYWRAAWNTTFEKTKTKILITKATAASNKIWNIGDYTVNSAAPAIFKGELKFKIVGLESNNVLLSIRNITVGEILFINKDGEYYYSYDFVSQNDWESISWCFYTEDGVSKTISNIEIEILPKYPDALVFDGVDDYGINENMPILTDYTIIAKREILGTYNGLISKRTTSLLGAFMFEKEGSWNFGAANSVIRPEGLITWQNSNLYNEQSIRKGTSVDTDYISIGSVRHGGELSNIAFYCAYLFYRSLDEQEIKAFIRKYIDPDYLLPSEIPTPDCYYDFTNGDNTSETRDTIKDYSGNGNDAVAHNFAWNEEGSGYKDGALYFDGVDDYISLDAFDSGFKTVFMVCYNNSISGFIYSQSNKDSNKILNMYINSSSNNIAYNMQNVDGKTYINGILNTTISAIGLTRKKHSAVCYNENLNDLETVTPTIGNYGISSSAFTKIIVSKFLGFKEALTEDQIQYVIKKYNLLDGVDDIEVS